MKSNKTTESELIRIAVDKAFDEMISANPGLQDLMSLALLRSIYGHGFVAGIKYGTTRVARLAGDQQ